VFTRLTEVDVQPSFRPRSVCAPSRVCFQSRNSCRARHPKTMKSAAGDCAVGTFSGRQPVEPLAQLVAGGGERVETGCGRGTIEGTGHALVFAEVDGLNG